MRRYVFGVAMKYFLLVMMFCSTACFGSTAEEIAMQYVSYFSKHDFKSAAKMIYCSDELNANQTKVKHAGLEKELAFLDQEFGSVTQHRISYEYQYVGATLGCAPYEYLKTQLPSAKKVVVEVLYDGKKKGYIVVGIILREGKSFPITVDHGIPMKGPASAARIMNVYKKLTEL
jgi:hypothetical protein